MNLKEINEILDLALNEELPANVDLDQIIINELKENELDLLDEVSNELEDQEEKLADEAGYKVYGGDGHKDNALVIDVKGRPDIDPEAIGKENDEAFWEELAAEVSIFAEQLMDEFEGFTVRGRMGGYWGLADLDHNLKISEHGFEVMKNEVVNLLNNPNLGYKEDLDQAQNEQEVSGVVYDVIYNNRQEIAGALIEDEDSIEIKPEFLEKMNKLSAIIDAQEAEMQKPEYWTEE